MIINKFHELNQKGSWYRALYKLPSMELMIYFKSRYIFPKKLVLSALIQLQWLELLTVDNPDFDGVVQFRFFRGVYLERCRVLGLIEPIEREVHREIIKSNYQKIVNISKPYTITKSSPPKIKHFKQGFWFENFSINDDDIETILKINNEYG